MFIDPQISRRTHVIGDDTDEGCHKVWWNYNENKETDINECLPRLAD